MERYRECPYFERCNAPICPMSDRSMKNCSWFTDEDICQKRDVPAWIKRQRRIAKTGKEFGRGCFTKAMLERKCRISSGLRGVNPDQGSPLDLQDQWLRNHPELAAKGVSPELAEARDKRALEKGFNVRSR